MTTADAPEVELFRSTTRSFLAKHAPLTTVRELYDRAVGFEKSWWRQGAELGWAGLLVPDELGGGSVSGDGLADLVSIAEEMGRVVAPGPLHPVSVVLAGLAESDTGERHADVIGALVAGESLATWAVAEPGCGWNPRNPETRADATASGFRLDGAKTGVEIADQADLLLVTARTSEGVGQFLVPTDAPGVGITGQSSIDMVKRFGRIRLDGVVVPATAQVGSIAKTASTIDRQSNIAVVLQCAETVGLLDVVFDSTVQWAFDRYTFGRPLASYQALKHRFADMKMWLEACRATTAEAAAALGARSPDAGLLASIAKSYVAERSTVIVQDCIQLHGGIGVTWEHDLHLYLRRAMLHRGMFGTPAEHSAAIFAHFEDQRNR